MSLFSTSFDEYITAWIVRVLSVLMMVISALGALIGLFVFLRAMGSSSPVTGILAGLLIVLWSFMFLVGARVLLESVIVVFKIGEDIAKIAGQSGPAVPTPTQPPPAIAPAYQAPDPAPPSPSTAAPPPPATAPRQPSWWRENP